MHGAKHKSRSGRECLPFPRLESGRTPDQRLAKTGALPLLPAGEGVAKGDGQKDGRSEMSEPDRSVVILGWSEAATREPMPKRGSSGESPRMTTYRAALQRLRLLDPFAAAHDRFGAAV